MTRSETIDQHNTIDNYSETMEEQQLHHHARRLEEDESIFTGPTDGAAQEEEEDDEGKCYVQETLETEYNHDTSVNPCNGLMFYYSAREKPVRLSAMEIDVRDDLSSDLTVQIYSASDATGDREFEKGHYNDPTYWTKIAETELIQHPDPEQPHRYLIPAYAFSKVALEPKQRNALYVRSTTGDLLDYTTNPFIKSHGEVSEIGSNLHVHAGYCLHAQWIYQLDTKKIVTFAGKFYEDVESNFCGFIPTTETSIEFVWVLDTNGEGLEFSKFEEELQVFAKDTILDDSRLAGYIEDYQLKISPKKKARVFFRRYNDCPSDYDFCEALVAKVFYEHLETLTPGQLKAQVYKHEPWLEKDLLKYLPLDQRIWPSGMIDEQAAFEITLENVPLQELDDVQKDFFQTNLLEFLKNQIPNDKAVVMDMKITGQTLIKAPSDQNGERRFLRGTNTRALMGNQIVLSGHFEGVRTGIEKAFDFATRIDAAIEGEQEKFLKDLKFEMGLPGNGMDSNGRHWMFYDISGMQSSVDADSLSMPIDWVPGRARVDDAPPPSNGGGGGPPEYTMEVVIAFLVVIFLGVALYFIVRQCVRYHIRKLSEKQKAGDRALVDEQNGHDILDTSSPALGQKSPYLVEDASESEGGGTKVFNTNASVDDTCENTTADDTDQSPRSPTSSRSPLSSRSPSDEPSHQRFQPDNILTPIESIRSLNVDSPAAPPSSDPNDSFSSSYSDDSHVERAVHRSASFRISTSDQNGKTLDRQESTKSFTPPDYIPSLGSRPARETNSLFPGARAARPSSDEKSSDLRPQQHDQPNWDEMVGALRKQYSEASLTSRERAAKPVYKLLDLRQMSAGQLKHLLVQHHLQYDPRQIVEKDDIIRILVLSEKVEVTSDVPGYVERRFSQAGGLGPDELEELEALDASADEEKVSIADMAAQVNYNRVRSSSFDATARTYAAPASSIVNHSMTAQTARGLQRTKSADFVSNRHHTTETKDNESESQSTSHRRGRKKPTRTKSSDDLGGKKSKSKHSSDSSKSSKSSGKHRRKAPVRVTSADNLQALAISDLWEDEPEDSDSDKKKKEKSSADEFERKKVKRSKSHDGTSSSRSKSHHHHKHKRDKSVDRKAPSRSHSSDAVHKKKDKSSSDEFERKKVKRSSSFDATSSSKSKSSHHKHKRDKSVDRKVPRRSRSSDDIHDKKKKSHKSSSSSRHGHRSRSRSNERHRSRSSERHRSRSSERRRHQSTEEDVAEEDLLLQMRRSLKEDPPKDDDLGASLGTFASTTNNDYDSDSDNSFENEIFGDE